MIVRTGILEHAVIKNAKKDITAKIALLFVPLIVRRVDTRTDCVNVKQDGWVQTVQTNASCPMVKIVNTNVVNTVSTRPVTDLMGVVKRIVIMKKAVN